MALFNTIVLKDVNTNVLVNLNDRFDNQRMELKDRILKARLHAGLSQEELAHKAGCTQDMISKLEQGIRKKTSHTVRIAKACGVNPFWLDAEEGEMITPMINGTLIYAQNDKQAKVLLAMQQMADYKQDMLVSAGDSLTKPDQNGTTGTNK